MDRQSIAEEAAKIFIMQGVKATTMDDIAKSLCISKRTIYEQFRDKRDLLDTIIGLAYEWEDKRRQEVYARSKNVLEAVIELLKIKMSALNIKIMNTIVEIKRYYPEIVDKRLPKGEELQRMEQILIKGIEEGVFRKDINPKISAFLFSEQVRTFCTEQFEKIELTNVINHEMSPMQAFEILFLNILRGISTPKGVRIIDRYASKNVSEQSEQSGNITENNGNRHDRSTVSTGLHGDTSRKT
jgi:AcrR family transcriptional regulator